MNTSRYWLGAACILFGMTAVSENAFAVAQWTRKYKTSCVTCHTMFPRLNYYGEKFKMNGYQAIDAAEPDGSAAGKKTYGGAVVGMVEDYMGVRLNMQPLQYDTKGQDKDGAKVGKLTVGQTGWLQLFTAGSIIKNVSIFDELEFAPSGSSVNVKHGWFTLGFHNLVGDRGLVNFRVGRISPKDWTSFSNRLRIYPDITARPDQVKNSAGASDADEQTYTSEATNGIDYYGTNGHLIWAVGVGNPSTTQKNQFLNYWGSLRANIHSEESEFEGSSVSIHYYNGTDTKAANSNPQVLNKFYRVEPALNLRYKDSEFVAAYNFGKDDNYTLSAANPRERKFKGLTLIGAYQLTSWFRPGVQFDRVWQADLDQNDVGFSSDPAESARFAINLGFRPAEVFQVFASAEYDVMPKVETAKNNKYTVTFRTMF